MLESREETEHQELVVYYFRHAYEGQIGQGVLLAEWTVPKSLLVCPINGK